MEDNELNVEANEATWQVPIVGARVTSFMDSAEGALITLDNGMMLEITGTWSLERLGATPEPSTSMSMETAEDLVERINCAVQFCTGLSVSIGAKTATMHWIVQPSSTEVDAARVLYTELEEVGFEVTWE